jgi:hypothetical protein
LSTSAATATFVAFAAEQPTDQIASHIADA